MRIVVHVDMDAFYAAVEERYTPRLRGLPVVVGADPKDGRGRGVVTTANYRARQFGIHSALPISRAWRLAEAARKRGEPATVFVHTNFRLYGEVSDRIMRILEASAQCFEEASIDEAYLDLSSLGSFEAALDHMTALKAEVQRTEELSCSVGIGPNKLVAKIASGYEKPDGLTLVKPENVQAFLEPLPIRVIPGIGPKSETFFHRCNIRTIRDLREISEPQLAEWFGKWGRRLFEKARGIDDSSVSNEWTRKSIGEQQTFQSDTRSFSSVTKELHEMAQRLVSGLREKNFTGFRTVTLTVRFADFETKNRSHSLKTGVVLRADEEALQLLRQESLKLILPFFDSRENPRGKAIRLIGLRLEKLF